LGGGGGAAVPAAETAGATLSLGVSTRSTLATLGGEGAGASAVRPAFAAQSQSPTPATAITAPTPIQMGFREVPTLRRIRVLAAADIGLAHGSAGSRAGGENGDRSPSAVHEGTVGRCAAGTTTGAAGGAGSRCHEGATGRWLAGAGGADGTGPSERNGRAGATGIVSSGMDGGAEDRETAEGAKGACSKANGSLTTE
jgi:hypothetical protein